MNNILTRMIPNICRKHCYREVTYPQREHNPWISLNKVTNQDKVIDISTLGQINLFHQVKDPSRQWAKAQALNFNSLGEDSGKNNKKN